MADLPDAPLSREEDYLASIAGQNVEVPPCPRSRKEAYLDAIDTKMDDIEEDIENLKNNPDVVDVVNTYADLQAYDKTKLTDNDIIRVLNDETHDGGSTYYRYSTATQTFTYIGMTKQYTNFVGTDGVTAGEAGLVPAPATADAGKVLKADGTWGEAGGGIKTLTSTDYNYPTETPDCIWPGMLSDGVYSFASGVRVKWTTGNYYFTDGGLLIIGPSPSSTYDKRVFAITKSSIRDVTAVNDFNSSGTNSNYVVDMSPQDNLTTQTSYMPLAASQGKVLNERIGNLSTLTTTAKTSAVAAINELDAEIGNIATALNVINNGGN